VIPHRERLLQLARLIGLADFTARFGPPQTAQPDDGDLRALIDEHLDGIGGRLLDEAVVSDDVIDRASADAYLEDRLATFGDLLTEAQAERLRATFRAGTASWA
jgi:hypothetical protein